MLVFRHSCRCKVSAFFDKWITFSSFFYKQDEKKANSVHKEMSMGFLFWGGKQIRIIRII